MIIYNIIFKLLMIDDWWYNCLSLWSDPPISSPHNCNMLCRIKRIHKLVSWRKFPWLRNVKSKFPTLETALKQLGRINVLILGIKGKIDVVRFQFCKIPPRPLNLWPVEDFHKTQLWKKEGKPLESWMESNDCSVERLQKKTQEYYGTKWKPIKS